MFASGSGSNFQALIDASISGSLQATMALCVSNRSTAGALTRAETAGIATCVLDPSDFDEATYAQHLLGSLEQERIDFIALAGYLRKIPQAVVDRFRGRMVNIHPALLPAHGGPGMYGKHVHRAVLEAGDEFSGATVHFVDEDYDTGAIILQDTVPVLPDDNPESLAARVLEIEHRLYPEALRLIAQGRVRVRQGRVTITFPLQYA